MLSFIHLLTTAFVLFTIYFVVTSFISWHRLRAFSGPFWASLSYFPMLRRSRCGRAHLEYYDISRKYGPLVRIGPNDLLTSDPELIRRMSAARSTYGRSSWYRATRLDPYYDTMASTRDVHMHDALKTKTAAGYAGKENPTLEAGIDSQLASLVGLLRSKYVSSPGAFKPVDFGKTAQFFTLDTLTSVAFGEPFGFLKKDDDIHEYLKTTDETVGLAATLAEVPWLQAVLLSSWMLSLVGPKDTDITGVGRLMGVAKSVVSERFGPYAKDKRDMLGSFVRHGLNQREAQTEALLQILAGSDTTATAIRATVLHIITSPRVYSKLLNEIDTAITDKRVSSPITNAEALQLPYLQAVIWEGLRSHPPFTGLAMKETGPNGDYFEGKFIPPGTRVAHSIWATTHDTTVFGSDVDVFRPERWIEADAALKTKMQKQTELVFGYGRWGCAGKTIAFIELNKVFVELFRNFDFEIMNPEKPWRSRNHNLFVQDEMWVITTARKPSV